MLSCKSGLPRVSTNRFDLCIGRSAGRWKRRLSADIRYDVSGWTHHLQSSFLGSHLLPLLVYHESRFHFELRHIRQLVRRH